MDDDPELYTEESLNKCSYRYLQQLAKSWGLPSNVKKTYLIEMIYAKHHCSEAEVACIVQKVKMERKQSGQGGRKKAKSQEKKTKSNLQGPEVSSTNTRHSPPIANTPKRRPSVISPDHSNFPQALVKYQPRPLLPAQPSDRVLRSYNVNTYKKRNYSIIEIIPRPKAEINVLRKEKEREEKPKINVASKCIVKQYRRPIYNSVVSLKQENHILPGSYLNTVPQTARQCRHLNLKPPQTIQTFPTQHWLGYRHPDGTLSKINARVEKYNQIIRKHVNGTNQKNETVAIQDSNNRNIDTKTFTNTKVTQVSEYTQTSRARLNMSYLKDIVSHTDASTSTSDIDEYDNKSMDHSFSVYCFKKMQSEQVCTQKLVQSHEVPRNVANEQPLPKIHDVFSKFSAVRDLFQPIYVQVGDPTSTVNYLPVLEKIYNLRFPGSQPLLQIPNPKVADTQCVHSSPPIMSVFPSPPSQLQGPIDPFYMIPPPPPSAMIPLVGEFASLDCGLIPMADQDKEEMSTSSSPLEPTQGSAFDTASIEDAMEIISQDGDYMERIEMDVRVQCILCDWAGPKFILEIHIRKEHSEQVVQQSKEEWNVTYKLGTLVSQSRWLSHVSEYENALYALSVRFEDPDCFMAAMSVVSHSQPRKASITIYNKVTGEPYSWEGEIPELPENMPYENIPQLKLELSKLELIPNSAKLKLVGRSLVTDSPGKTVVGQPQLNDIQIIIFVHFF